MLQLVRLLVRPGRDAAGQGLAEYALILALIFLGGQISSILSNVGRSI